ncbi:MAG: cobalt ABC transporter permease [Nitrospirae bacterium]|nr:cobalt ABC transporter permease [Nitrospirota bacterium]
MRSQKSRVGSQKRRRIIFAFFLLFTIHCSLCTAVFASGKWQGVDESVVEKYAKEHGREAVAPLINTDRGDLLLFVFLAAGAAGGFVCGYYWRILMVEKAPKTKKEDRGISG